ncbi:serine/threonine protein kinase [Lipingzhangella halophila]|uniref:non-specific serine/threonine protein kinase n=1 Tax=Lipingzhangella halophila TaxID=1783352 RepID=A0A7W7RD48_9ACTN|nr:serine/threonine-protein kinase [Lipingzhangella halophila]MBB4929779.1 serine/threonine protein kinase [Lipingzhangella halophila]
MTSGSDTRVVAGRYQIQRQLGRGGMGVVWQAWDPELEREVAIKEVLLPEELTPDERREMHFRTRREARSAAKLSHPSIITIHDVLDFEDHPWIVMELVDGKPLDKMLKESGPLPPERVATIAKALLDSLLLAHSKGVIHRDIKPGNVMLTDNERVILTDFGIATIDGETTITRTGALIGSPEYMAPERLQQESSDAPSDIWSLGVTLFAATEGQSPFKRETVTASISAVLSAPIPPPQRAGPLTPLLMGMLDRDPARRLAAPQAAQLLTASMPTQAMGPPSGTNPSLAPTAGMPPPTQYPPGHQPPPQQYPPGQQPPPQQYPPHAGQPGPNGPVDPNGPPSGSAAAGGNNKRKVYMVAGAIAAALVLGVASAAWAATRPETSEYQLYGSGDYSFEYPVDWDVSEDDDGRATASHPDSREEISFVVDSYEPERTNPRTEIEEKSEGEWETTDWDGYEMEDLQRTQQDYLPDRWKAATWVFRYTNDDRDHPNRYSVRHQVHVESDWDDTAVWLRWDLPEGQETEYQDVIEHVNRSLRP